MLDKRLLIVERFLETEGDLQMLADELELSQRQLTRLLKDWQTQGYISYQPGVGRGNKMKIKLNLDVERELFMYLKNNKDQLSLQELQSYLTLPWHPASESIIRKNLIDDYGDDDISFMDYVYMIPKVMHPAHAIDIVSATINQQVYETLYYIDEFGSLQSNLLRYSEWQDNALHLYLNKEICFSDGDILTAHHVKDVMLTLKNDSIYKSTFQELIDVEIESDYVLKLVFSRKLNHIKYMLTEPFTCIYKTTDEGLLGTGIYEIELKSDSEIVLKTNPYHSSIRPDIRTIYFIANLKKYYVYNTTAFSSKLQTSVYRNDDFVVINPAPGRLTLEQRGFLKHAILHLAKDYSIISEDLYEWVGAPVSGMPEKEGMPAFDRPIRVLSDEFTASFMGDFKAALAEYGVTIEIVEVKHTDYLAQHLDQQDVDMVWMSESITQMQPMFTLNLLTNCKSKEWFADLDGAKEMLHAAEEQPVEAVRPIAQDYLQSLFDAHYYIPLRLKTRYVILPEEMKNVVERPYGILDYSKIVVMK